MECDDVWVSFLDVFDWCRETLSVGSWRFVCTQGIFQDISSSGFLLSGGFFIWKVPHQILFFSFERVTLCLWTWLLPILFDYFLDGYNYFEDFSIAYHTMPSIFQIEKSFLKIDLSPVKKISWVYSFPCKLNVKGYLKIGQQNILKN
jgi:hypothetical protein